MSDGRAGVRVRDHLTGVVTLDTDIRAGRSLGVITTTSASGSINNPALLEGDLFCRVGLVTSASSYPNTNLVRQLSVNNVVASGQTLSWQFVWGTGSLPPGNSYQILYGVY